MRARGREDMRRVHVFELNEGTALRLIGQELTFDQT